MRTGVKIECCFVFLRLLYEHNTIEMDNTPNLYHELCGIQCHMISYDSSRNCEMICPIELLRLMNEFPYEKVSDNMIQHYLTLQSFTDLSIDHKGDETSSKEHGKRIASIINLIRQGVHITPVHLYINARMNEIQDGWHRFRAHLYLNQYMPVYLHPPE